MLSRSKRDLVARFAMSASVMGEGQNAFGQIYSRAKSFGLPVREYQVLGSNRENSEDSLQRREPRVRLSRCRHDRSRTIRLESPIDDFKISRQIPVTHVLCIF